MSSFIRYSFDELRAIRDAMYRDIPLRRAQENIPTFAAWMFEAEQEDESVSAAVA